MADVESAAAPHVDRAAMIHGERGMSYSPVLSAQGILAICGPSRHWEKCGGAVEETVLALACKALAPGAAQPPRETSRRRLSMIDWLVSGCALPV